jgi:hypothetical protein
MYYRDRFDVPLTDKQVQEIQYLDQTKILMKLNILKIEELNLVVLFQKGQVILNQ